MDENQQPSVTQELGRPFPSIRGRGFRLITCFMSFLKFDLPRLQFEVFQIKSELFGAISVVLLRQVCQRKHVLNYASKDVLVAKEYTTSFASRQCSIIISYRSSDRRCSVKKGVLSNLATFTGQHLCQSFFFNKVVGLFRTPPDDCFQSQY